MLNKFLWVVNIIILVSITVLAVICYQNYQQIQTKSPLGNIPGVKYYIKDIYYGEILGWYIGDNVEEPVTFQMEIKEPPSELEQYKSETFKAYKDIVLANGLSRIDDMYLDYESVENLETKQQLIINYENYNINNVNLNLVDYDVSTPEYDFISSISIRTVE